MIGDRSFTAPSWQPVHEESLDGLAPDLARHLHAALFALRHEDSALAHAFSMSRPEDEVFYQSTSRGLGYWVFETTAVYAVFKAWIPLGPVAWERGYPDRRGAKADLVVFAGDGDGVDPPARWVFEAKWWTSTPSGIRPRTRGSRTIAKWPRSAIRKSR